MLAQQGILGQIDISKSTLPKLSHQQVFTVQYISDFKVFVHKEKTCCPDPVAKKAGLNPEILFILPQSRMRKI